MASREDPTPTQAGPHYSYGRGHSGSGKAEVLDLTRPTGKHTFVVVLVVEKDWQAQAIAAILNGG